MRPWAAFVAGMSCVLMGVQRHASETVCLRAWRTEDTAPALPIIFL